MKLHRLTPQGRALINSAFLADPTGTVPTNSTYTSPVDSAAMSIDGLLREAQHLCASMRAGDPELDGALAKHVHRHLPLGRRLGSDMAIWAWLAAGPFAFFVRHRWGPAKPPNAGRFRGSLNENSLARLWWTWELFAHPRNERAERVLRGQYLIDRLVSNEVVRYEHVAHALVDAMVDINDNVRMNVLATHLKRLATSLALECMTRAEVVELILRLNRELPKGRSVV